ncbi:MAG: exodeoxyribonuclease VII large subunit [Bacteroidales bacterium]|nr:exodeoxyribonuclease VII large subunit [Bacteroidales bacterium]
MEQELTLLELNRKVKDTLARDFPDNYWVIAEISEMKVNRKGHCYLDLVEKDEMGDRIIAKARGMVWSYTFRMLKPYFENATGQEFKAGLKIMVHVRVEFHELYGYSLHIADIEPSYTLGEMARTRMETIRKLEQEGIIHMNKQLTLSEVPQKIAVISSQTAAGYKDFMEQLHNNPYGYVFYPKLFPAYMQGDQAESSIIDVLEDIYQYEHIFDLVAIIRGGGAQADLSCFDHYTLAAHVAQFPLPVISGIGHEKDESVVDLVVHTKLKTPTAVADFLVNRGYQFEERLLSARDQIVQNTSRFIQTEHQRQQNLSGRIVPNINALIERTQTRLERKAEKLTHLNQLFIQSQHQHLRDYSARMSNKSQRVLQNANWELNHMERNFPHIVEIYIQNKNKHLSNLEQAKKHLDPKNVLKRGFSITQKGGQTITSAQQAEPGDTLTTRLYEGSIQSTVQKNNGG